ncbi:hypothetical protein ACFV6F_11685 [Kitasatospora phosalacinea]|uniref:hypothetical protein n=1 Tax=Kitasatospora phosalacinea TaxID=2065 RepID=UPI00365B5274
MTENRASAPSTGPWPAVSAEVVAEVVSALSERLRKRLDGAAAKLADRPVVRTGDEWTVRIDEEAALVLHAPGGTVRAAGDIRCTCLLAPGCLHRAAAVTTAPLAEPEHRTEPEDRIEPEDRTGTECGPPSAAPAPATPDAQDAVAAGAAEHPLTPPEAEAVDRLRRAAAHTLAAGVSGAGSVLQAELLRTAHQARLLGLHRPAALATTVVTRLRAARAAEPDHRLADLAAAHRDLLDATTVTAATDPRTLRGTARQTYREVGSLRLYGLFAEPVVTATHAGVAVWTVDADGSLATVSEITPHGDPAGAARLARAAVDRPLRLGETSLSHRGLARGGLLLQGATRTASGRLGAGAAVRAVGAAGVDWHQPPVARLWQVPARAQVERALRAERTPYELRAAGSDLLFLDVTLLGARTVPGSAAPVLLADCAGLTVLLQAAQSHPQLAFAANLALLAAVPGLRLRIIGRLERAAHPRLHLLAAAPTPEPEPTLTLPDGHRQRVSLGFEPLQHADLPPAPPGRPAVPPAADLPPQPPLHLLARPLEQAVTGGRSALSTRLTRSTAREEDHLRTAGLATAGHLLAALRTAAADQQRDTFGRLRTDDHHAYATAWLAAALYREELATALCTASWSPT